MFALVFAALLANGTVAAKPAHPAPGVKDSVGIGRFTIQDGTENASWLVTRFRESLWQRDLDRAARSQALKWQIDMKTLAKTTKKPRHAVVPITFRLGE